MPVAIFTSREAADSFAARVDEALGYPRPGTPEAPYPYGWTLRHADVREHPEGGRWAYPLGAVPVAPPTDAVVVDALEEDWALPTPES